MFYFVRALNSNEARVSRRTSARYFFFVFERVESVKVTDVLLYGDPPENL